MARSPSLDRATTTGVVLGTPRYLAPERIRGEPATVACDIYAVGVVLYEALAGRPPFDAANSLALAYAVERAQPVPLPDLRVDLDPQLSAVVHRALAAVPADRFPSATSTAHALNRITGETPALTPPRPLRTTTIAAPPPTATQRTSRRTARFPATRWRLGAGLLAGLAAVVVTVIATVAVLASGDSNGGGASDGPTTTSPPAPTIATSAVPPELQAAIDELQQAIRP